MVIDLKISYSNPGNYSIWDPMRSSNIMKENPKGEVKLWLNIVYDGGACVTHMPSLKINCLTK